MTIGAKKTNSTASYAYQPYVGTADTDAYRKSVQNADFTAPINSAYGQAANDINDTTFEEALPAGVAERIKSGRMFRLNEDRGAALSGAAERAHQAITGGEGNLAAMTQNPFVQTGGTSQSNVFGPAFAAALGHSLGGGNKGG